MNIIVRDEGGKKPRAADVAFPTPEKADEWIKSHEFWWLAPDGKSYRHPRGHSDMLIENKDLFGLTQAEIERATAPTVDKQEFIDRVLHLHEVVIERGWIYCLVNAIAVVAPTAIPVVCFWFQFEKPEVYDRLKQFLKAHDFLKGLVRLKDIMCRTWDQPIQSLFMGAQYSKSGLQPTCQYCGKEMSFDEMLHTGICPKCGNPLC